MFIEMFSICLCTLTCKKSVGNFKYIIEHAYFIDISVQMRTHKSKYVKYYNIANAFINVFNVF